MQAWTATEEQAFSRLMEAGRMERMKAIRLYRRCKGNLKRALAIAAANTPTAEEATRRAALGERARLRAAETRQAVSA
jgi:hypothetical protein